MIEHHVDVPVSNETAAAFLLMRLLRHGWKFGLSADGDLTVIFGDDPPRLSQQQAMEHVVRLTEELKALVRASEQLTHNVETVH
jgi:hypothetical protein